MGLHRAARQQQKIRGMCFGHFLDVNEICFTGQFCHHILLRECHVDNAENEMWFVIGGNRIRFSANEFCLVSGLHLGDTVVPTIQEDDMCRIWQKYFKGAKKVTGTKLQSLFERLEEENDDDDDMIKLALLLILEMTLLGKYLRTKVEYWAMELVDNLEEFNWFPWGSYVYSRTLNSLSTCCKGRDQKFMEKAQKDPSHTVKKINLYGFVYAFQVWAIEAIPLYSKNNFATKVSRTAPRILNWEVKTSPGYEALRTKIFSRRKISTFQTLKPTEEELKLSYFTGLETAAISNDQSALDIEIGDQEDDEYCDENHSDDVAEEEQPQPKDKQAEIQEERPIGRRPSDSQDLHTEVACLQTFMTALNDKVDKGFATLQIELDEMRKGVEKLIEVVCKT
ncbi:hypothetical protein ACOSP7_028160 [Xanthoceras sorbifolium]